MTGAAIPNRRDWFAAMGLGACAAFVVLLPGPAWLPAAVATAILAVPFAFWLLARPNRWISAFLGATLLLPPLPLFAVGNSGPHPALLFAAVGLWSGLVRLRAWRLLLDPLSRAMLLFLAILLGSLAPAAIYSGVEVAAGSLARVLLLGIAIYLYLFAAHGPGATVKPDAAAGPLLWAGLLTALFACLDFYFQFPAPAGYGAQFVWLDVGVLRRAQGLFYEASTLGNLCAFYLIFIAAIYFHRGKRHGHWLLHTLAGLVIAVALILSYSRASVLALAVGLVAMLALSGKGLRYLLTTLLLLTIAASLIYLAFPEFAQSYWIRLQGSAGFFLEDPNRVLSGRLAAWQTAFERLRDQPWLLVTGAGYKTLPYGDPPLIVDNMYLSLLVETGIAGLAAFLWLNFCILRHAWQARATLFGTTMFCFWTGEMVQMLSGDLFTYWRILPLYFWMLAHARPVR